MDIVLRLIGVLMFAELSLRAWAFLVLAFIGCGAVVAWLVALAALAWKRVFEDRK